MLDRWLEGSSVERPEIPMCELWERYLEYGIYFHGVYGFYVCNMQSGARINPEPIQTLEEARRYIENLPPPPSIGEIYRQWATKRASQGS